MLHPTSPGSTRRTISCRQLFTIVAFLVLSSISSIVHAQTNPTATALPFSLTSISSGSLPVNVAVHRFGTSAGSIPTSRTTSPGNGDLPYQGTTASSNTGGWFSLGTDGIGMLASGSNAAGAIVVAVNTTGSSNIQVSWLCKTILDQTSRDNSIALQYRVGTSGNFIDVGTTSTYSTRQASTTFTETLPAAANNQSVVQVRWVYYESGPLSGSRDKLSVTNISITAPVAPSCTSVTPGIINSNIAGAACAPATVILSLTGATTSGVNYQWKSSPDSLVWTNVGANNDSLNTGTLNTSMYYKAIVSCTSGSVKDSTPVYKLTVNPAITPSVTVAANTSDTICAGTAVTFTATPVNEGTAPVYVWKKGAAVVGANSATYTDNALADGDVITVSVVSNATCASAVPVNSNSVTMTVNPVLTPSVTIAANPGNAICAGIPVTFTATPVNGGTPVYEWKKGTAVVGTNSPTYTDNALANGDVVSVTLTSNATCASTTPVNSNNITMTVNPVLTPSVTIAATPGNTICAGTSVTFTATPVNGGSLPVYQWKKGATVVGTNSPTYTDNALANGNAITVTMTSNENCASTTPVTSTAINMTVNPLTAPGVGVIVSPDDTICAGTNVTFTAVSTNGGSNPVYVWKKGATVVGTNSATYSNNALVNGDVITVTLTSNATCTSTAPVTSSGITMTVNPVLAPSVTIAANPGNTICAGTSVTFTATPVNGGTAPVYVWKKGTTVVGTNSPVYTANSLASGDVITVTMTSSAACVSAASVTSSGITMAVTAVPVASVAITANPGNTICAGTSVTFTAAAVNGGSTPVYQWKKGATTVGTNTPTYTDNALANGDVISVSLTSNATCASTTPATSNNITMTVNPVLNPSVVITPFPNDTICAGTPVTFTVAAVYGGTAPVFQWKKGATVVGTNSPSYTDNALVTGNVITVTMTSNATCANTTPVTSTGITMLVRSPLVPDVTLSVNPPGNICSGTPVTYTATSVNGGNAPTYIWKSNGITVGGSGPTFTNNTPLNNDTVTCIMTSNLGCITKAEDTARMITQVTKSVIPVVIITAAPGTTIIPGTNVTYTANVINGGTVPVYQWKKNNMVVGTNSNTYATTAWAVNDTITCTVTSNAICATPGVVTSNKLVMKSSTGIGQVNTSGNNITLYPNPNNGDFTVAGNVKGNKATLEVLSMVGQVVYREEMKLVNGQVNQLVHLPQGLTNGTYVLRVASVNGNDVIRFNVAR